MPPVPPIVRLHFVSADSGVGKKFPSHTLPLFARLIFGERAGDYEEKMGR